MLKRDHLYSFSTACEGPPQLSYCTKLLEVSTHQISCILFQGGQTQLHRWSLGIIEGCTFILKTHLRAVNINIAEVNHGSYLMVPCKGLRPFFFLAVLLMSEVGPTFGVCPLGFLEA